MISKIRALSCSPWKYSKPTKLTMTGQTVIKPVVRQKTTKTDRQSNDDQTNYKLINNRKINKTYISRTKLIYGKFRCHLRVMTKLNFEKEIKL